jgi:thiol-disulfide isomerase/thioredoxin
LLQEKEENKPLVVVIYADWCPLCQSLKPTLLKINEEYKGRIRFVRLDVTDSATTAKSKTLARSFGLEQFFKENLAITSLVIIQNPAGHEVFRAVHDNDFEHYAKVLDQQLHVVRP